MADLRPLLTVWGTWLVLMAGANVAAPLYAVYATRYGFSSFVLTAIFTVYAVVLVPTLLIFGRVSDRDGRRPVMFAGVLAGAAGLIVFAAARDTAWLFAARALQGLAARRPLRWSSSIPSATPVAPRFWRASRRPSGSRWGRSWPARWRSGHATPSASPTSSSSQRRSSPPG
jgi:MFS family permease